MHNCKDCAGSCGACGGCRSLTITQAEAALLDRLAQIPFLPVVCKADGDSPLFPEDDSPDVSLALLCLEKKGLITLDYDLPLSGFDYTPYSRCALHGSMALTARGQEVLAQLDRQGAAEEV